MRNEDMPPDTAVAEPPVEQATPPVVEPPKPLSTKPGDKYREAFAKIEKEVREPKAQDVVPEPTPPIAPEVKVEPEVKPSVEKPSSPLDVVTAEPKEAQKEEIEDHLKDIPAQLETKNEKVRSDWERLRARTKEIGDKYGEAKRRLAELETAPKPQPEEILAISKERDALKERLEKQEESLKALNYQYSETFQNMVADRDQHAAKIQARVERYGGDSDKLMSALTMPDGKAKSVQIKEALAEVDSEDRTRIHTLIEGLDERNEKIALEAKSSSSRWDELQTKRTAELAEEQAKAIKGLESEFTKIASDLPATTVTMRTVPDDIPDASNWNAEIKAAREMAMRVLTPGGSNAKESMEIALKGARYDSLEKRYLALHKEWLERGKRLAQYDSGGPDFKGGDKPKTEQKLSPVEKYHKAMAASKAAAMD